MSRKQKRNLKRLIIEIIIFILLVIIDHIFNLASLIKTSYSFLLPFVIYFALYIVVGKKVLKKAIKNIKHKKILDENFLMTLATLGAFGLGLFNGFKGNAAEGFDEGVAVILFYEVGEFFEDYAINKSRNQITSLLELKPEKANLFKDGKIIETDPESVNVDDILLIKPGERIPIDGIVIEGNTLLDMKSINGETIPLEIKTNEKIISGSVNISNQIKIKVIKKYEDSTIAKILDLVENASNYKSKSENFISIFARYYTPIVVSLSLLLFVIPSIITKEFDIWLYRALSFLVVSCPCALVISIPLSFFSGLGKASKNQILIKGSNYLEKFNKANVFVFDKTGTLTKGNFKIQTIYPEENKNKVIELASIAEANSNHPIAKSICSLNNNIDKTYTIEEISGKGIKAIKENNIILCGNDLLMIENNIDYIKSNDVGSIVYVALNGQFVGYISIVDEIKKESYELVDYLKNNNYKSIMLSGDNENVCSYVSSLLKLDMYKSKLLPTDKVDELRNLLNEKDVVCYIGDGINDAPVLAISDIGIAMGKKGQDIAIESSDIVFINDDLKSIIKTKKIAKTTMNVVKQNIIFAILVKVLILVLSALGITSMYMAIFGDVGVAFIAILNSLRVNLK